MSFLCIKRRGLKERERAGNEYFWYELMIMIGQDRLNVWPVTTRRGNERLIRHPLTAADVDDEMGNLVTRAPTR